MVRIARAGNGGLAIAAGNANRQLPLFAFSKEAQNNHRSYYWLKDIASADTFCFAGSLGYSGKDPASTADDYIRPRFVIA